MKTYFEIADEYAKEMFPDHEYITDWYSFLNYYADKHVEWFGQYYMVLAKRYAQEVAQQALNNAADKVQLVLSEYRKNPETGVIEWVIVCKSFILFLSILKVLL